MIHDKLFIACVTFFVIDLMLVGTTCITVILVALKILRGKVEFKIGHYQKRIDRDYIEKGI